jgi:hypothetical protein
MGNDKMAVKRQVRCHGTKRVRFAQPGVPSCADNVHYVKQLIRSLL